MCALRDRVLELGRRFHQRLVLQIDQRRDQVERGAVFPGECGQKLEPREIRKGKTRGQTGRLIDETDSAGIPGEASTVVYRNCGSDVIIRAWVFLDSESPVTTRM